MLLACYVTRRGDRPQEGEGRSVGWGGEGQGTQQRPLSSWIGPSVKCVFLQFEKVESGQIGVLSSSDCMSYAPGEGRDETWGLYEEPGTGLIDTFSSSERKVKPSVVLHSSIPGQTGCLYSDGQGEGERCHWWMRLDAGNGYGVTGQRHKPHNTLQPQGHSNEGA